MRVRRRRNERDNAGGAETNGPNSNLRNVRREAEDLLAAADNAIEETVSRDHNTFLYENRQRGGQ